MFNTLLDKLEDNNIINVDTSKIVTLWEKNMAETQFNRLCSIYDDSPKVKIENVFVQNHEIYVSAQFLNRSERLFMVLNYHDSHLDEPNFYDEFPDEKPDYIYSFYPDFSILFDLKNEETKENFEEIITLAQAEAPEYDHSLIDMTKIAQFDRKNVSMPHFQNIENIISPIPEENIDDDMDK